MLSVVVHLVTSELGRLIKCSKFEASTVVDVNITVF
jgi:hypothetical protein